MPISWRGHGGIETSVAAQKVVIARLDRATQCAAASPDHSNVSRILDHPLEPVIGLAEGETRWRVMTVSGVNSRRGTARFTTAAHEL
jgi:hypothetical protein